MLYHLRQGAFMVNNRQIDIMAISASGLCLLHCLALPFLASLLPLLTGIADNEWIHKFFVIVALFATGFALLRSKPGRDRVIFAALATVGAALLFASAYIHALHDIERPLTIVGALLLASAHLFRWRCHTSPHSKSFPLDDHIG